MAVAWLCDEWDDGYKERRTFHKMVSGGNAQDSGSSDVFPLGMVEEEVVEVVNPVLELLSTLLISMCISFANLQKLWREGYAYPVTLLAAHDSDRSLDGGKESESWSCGEHEVTCIANQISFNQTVTENNTYDWLVGGCWYSINVLGRRKPTTTGSNGLAEGV